jgi:hypothetical protein
LGIAMFSGKHRTIEPEQRSPDHPPSLGGLEE